MNKNVLVFPCGSEIGLEINNALKFEKNITLYGASSTLDHGRMVYENYIELPYLTDKSFKTRLQKVIKKYNIDFIFPAHDSVVLELSKIANEIDAKIISSDYETCNICRSKQKTYNYFSKENFVPKVYNKVEEVEKFPVFLKPDVGQGSNGCVIANNKEELLYYIAHNSSLLILEYLPNEEYTIDCFTDKNGNLKFAGMRQRKRIKSGISVNSITQEIPNDVLEIAKNINAKLKLQGMWFFQVKIDSLGKYKLLEIAPRIAGTMCLYRNQGINFALLSIYDKMGYDVEIFNNNVTVEVDRALTNRYLVDFQYDNIYIDFDDTIVNKHKVNPYVMMFLYQSLNNNKKIYLITKHINNIVNTLEEYRISLKIFDKIIQIKPEDEKYKYIKGEKSIFIDDSFGERYKIYKNINIPCYSIDMLESLIDWRN